MEQVTACVIECRFEDLFAATTARLAAALPYPTWVLDPEQSRTASQDPDEARRQEGVIVAIAAYNLHAVDV